MWVDRWRGEGGGKVQKERSGELAELRWWKRGLQEGEAAFFSWQG